MHGAIAEEPKPRPEFRKCSRDEGFLDLGLRRDDDGFDRQDVPFESEFGPAAAAAGANVNPE